MIVSPGEFELSIVFGGAVIALWIATRFPDFGPTGVWSALLHIVAAYVVASVFLRLAPGFLVGAVPQAAAGAALTFAVLPPVVYLWTTIAWFIRTVQRLSGAYR